MHGAEIELKFPVSDPLAFSRQVEALGFHLQTERTLEQNTLYDTPTRDLQARRQILRLRTYGSHCTVTHKRQPATPNADIRYKTRIETESSVDDCDALAEIFLQLGYVPVFHYDKFRTDFIQAGVTQFGSGWAWVAVREGKLSIMKTPNGENPLVHGATPILGADVWEHSYYIDYRNARPKYLEAFVDSLINWDYVLESFEKAAK